MSNYHLRDMRLSNKAKGLFSIILSLPEEWDYTIDGLVNICKDGYDGIRAQIIELEQCGYITRERVRNTKGQLNGTDYIIHENPVITTSDAKPTLEKPILDNPTLEKPIQAKPTQENPRQSNKDLSITNISNT